MSVIEHVTSLEQLVTIEEMDLEERGERLADLMAENATLRELVRAAWQLFTEHGAVNPCDLPEVDAVRDRMRELGVDER